MAFCIINYCAINLETMNPRLQVHFCVLSFVVLFRWAFCVSVVVFAYKLFHVIHAAVADSYCMAVE